MEPIIGAPKNPEIGAMAERKPITEYESPIDYKPVMAIRAFYNPHPVLQNKRQTVILNYGLRLQIVKSNFKRVKI